jgi:hypothetical protein
MRILRAVIAAVAAFWMPGGFDAFGGEIFHHEGHEVKQS